MKPILAKILTIAPFVLILGGLGVALASGSPDYPSLIKEKLDTADRMTLEAKEASCRYIGILTNDCYARKSRACRMLDAQEKEYTAQFGSNSFDDCFTPDAPETESQNPAFFGDGER